jgi:ABC-type antimicrobial peptide transport system permease subunit
LAEHDQDEPPGKPRWAGTALGVSHCGAGCTLGDIAAEFAVFGIGLTIAGQSLYAEMIGDYLIALALGIVFQYFAIAPGRGLGVGKGLALAAKADVLSLTSFEIGLFAWMAVMALAFYPAPHHLHPDDPVYWLLMQIGMIIGFATAWPTNAWLIRRGIKQGM